MAWRNYGNIYRTRNKFGASKIESGGLCFDSKKEARRYDELKILESKGEISNLQRQVKYILIPSQRGESEGIYKRGPKKGQEKPGRVIERECSYIADFTYRDKDGRDVVEDTKGMRTKEYIIKRKLMLYIHKIQIREI